MATLLDTTRLRLAGVARQAGVARSSLCKLCVLCVSAVVFAFRVHHRDTENTEVAQRRGLGPALCLLWLLLAPSVAHAYPTALDGYWRFELDPTDAGLQ